MLRRLLAHPSARNANINDSAGVEVRRRILQQKQFLKNIYREWYSQIVSVLPDKGTILELGSGPGFLREFIPDAITSDVSLFPGVSLALDAQLMPFKNRSLSAIVMVNVLHHLSRPRDFFAEAERCLTSTGVIAMIEPWVTNWSRFIYGRFHHEPFLPDANCWESTSLGPFSGANQALPWIIFQRDREMFRSEFPQFQINTVRLEMPFTYLVSGGIGMRQLLPTFLYGTCRAVEKMIGPWMNNLAMFAFVVLQKDGDSPF